MCGGKRARWWVLEDVGGRSREGLEGVGGRACDGVVGWWSQIEGRTECRTDVAIVRIFASKSRSRCRSSTVNSVLTISTSFKAAEPGIFGGEGEGESERYSTCRVGQEYSALKSKRKA